jgi:hypothetical protein
MKFLIKFINYDNFIRGRFFKVNLIYYNFINLIYLKKHFLISVNDYFSLVTLKKYFYFFETLVGLRPIINNVVVSRYKKKKRIIKLFVTLFLILRNKNIFGFMSFFFFVMFNFFFVLNKLLCLNFDFLKKNYYKTNFFFLVCNTYSSMNIFNFEILKNPFYFKHFFLVEKSSLMIYFINNYKLFSLFFSLNIIKTLNFLILKFKNL